MLVPPCRLVLFDCTDNALVLTDSSSGHVLSRHPLTPSRRPLTLLGIDDDRSLLIANSRTDSALFVLHHDTRELSRLPAVLPMVTAACLAPSGESLFCSSAQHTLYRLDLSSDRPIPLGSAPHPCTALAADDERVYSVWETADGSICAVHDTSGRLLCEHRLHGTIPSVTLAGETLCLPFAGGRTYGEGLYLLRTDQAEQSVTTISLRPPNLRGLSAYPYSVLTTDTLLCLVSESSGTITKIDRRTNEIIGSYALGRSISHLCLLPDRRFAIATSNMFADLTLLDLVNEKLLSISICPHELFHRIIVLPPA